MQFNLIAGDGNGDSINASENILSTNDSIKNIGMQLGPDGKIYVCNGDSTLNVINFPDKEDTACDYVSDAVLLYNHPDQFTLPDIIAGYRYGNTAPDCNYLSAGHSATNAACEGATGSITEDVSGGIGAYTITWNTTPPQTGNTLTNVSPGTYVATITGVDPCIGNVTILDTIIIERGDIVLAVPNAFTPTIAGENSVFVPHIECPDNLEYTFRVYNRWGQLLFQTNDPTAGWDGKYNGIMEEVGVYDYYIEFTCGNCTEYKQGNITLLK
jgi:gliding motility-associated-like protein